MILNPGIIALILASLLAIAFAAYGSFTGIRIIRHWDLSSGTPTQLNLERKTYLVSVNFAYVSAFQLLSLFMFIYTAEHIHTLFVGAMCAAGSLNANGYGYPTLVLKGINFFNDILSCNFHRHYKLNTNYRKIVSLSQKKL